MAKTLTTLLAAIAADPGLKANNPVTEINLGLAAAATLDDVLLKAIATSKVNDDGILSAADMQAISDTTYANPADYVKFLEAHGNDNGNVVSGFHYVQNDGGTLKFQGRDFIDTVADAIYHFGFKIKDGRYFNEDGNDNEKTEDVAGWLNYFLNGVNVVHGTAGKDELGSGVYSEYFAAARNETFLAGEGDDAIWADLGNDRVYGGNGNDRSGGGMGNDLMYGEAGNDSLWGDEGQDTIDGGMGRDVLGGSAGNDALYGGGDNDELYGDVGNDLIRGGDGADTQYGDVGIDRLEGGAGNDILHGGEGRDAVLGDAGDDRLSGGEGSDYLRGGLGADTFVLWENKQMGDTLYFAAGDSGKTRATIDHVEGFVSGVDKIFFAASNGMTFEDLDYKGGGANSCYHDGKFLRVDYNGDAVTDMIIEMRWVESLAVSDFIFG